MVMGRAVRRGVVRLRCLGLQPCVCVRAHACVCVCTCRCALLACRVMTCTPCRLPCNPYPVLSSDVCDTRSALEANAYSCWMAGNVLLEKESDWTRAMAQFTRAK